MNVNDYVILDITGGKKDLAKIVAKKGERLKVVLEKDLASDVDQKYEFTSEAVFAVLGPNPKPGSVYGVKVEPLRSTHDAGFFGTLSVFANFNSKQLAFFEKAMSSVEDKLYKMKLPELPFNTELRAPQGKYAGMYKYSPSKDCDTMIVRPDENLQNLDYILSHEYAHGIWYNCMTPKMHLAWLRKYQTAVAVESADDRVLKEMLAEVKSNGLSDYAKGADPDVVALLRAVMRHIKQVHSIDRKHLELMLMLDEPIDDLWPTFVEVSTKEVLLTDYAKKSVEELFAESFAYHFIGKKIPKSLAELLEKCLTKLHAPERKV